MTTPDTKTKSMAKLIFSETMDPSDSPNIAATTITEDTDYYAGILRKGADQLDLGKPLEIQIRWRHPEVKFPPKKPSVFRRILRALGFRLKYNHH